MSLPLANVNSTDTFQTWLTRTNQIITEAANSTPLTVDVQQSLSVGDYIDFGGVTHYTLTPSEGRVYYDSTHKSLTLYGEGNIQKELGLNEYIRVYNAGAVAINKGQPLYISGTTGGIPNAYLANASDAAKYNISGLAAQDISTSNYGYIAVSGVIRDFDTSMLTAGERFFVSPSANGQLTTPAPTYPNYPMCVGLCLVSDSANGEVVIEQQNHSVPSFRVINDAYVSGGLTVGGNFNVLGTETVTSLSNLQVDDTFVYLNSGDTVTANTTLATGLKDLTFKGHYNGGNNVTYYVKIDNTGSGDDTFSWSLDNFSSTEAANVAIDGTEQTLRWGIKVQFVANTGHTAGDIWTGVASPLNVDTGWASNRNPGHAAGGYTHLGVFHDVTDNRFRFFQSYEPEISGNINVGHASFEYGSVQANTFYGTFNGDGSSLTSLSASQLTSGTIPDARFPATLPATNGASLTSLNASELTSGTVPIGRLSASGITLGSHTTGNYVATVANTDNNVTVSGSGSETAAVYVGLADNLNLSGTVTASAFVGNLTGVSSKIANNFENSAGNFSGFVNDGGGNLGLRFNATSGGTNNLVEDGQAYEIQVNNDTDGGDFVIYRGTTSSGTAGDTITWNAQLTLEGDTGDAVFAGSVDAANFNSTSDVRLKENIQPIEGALDKVMSLAGVEFDWNATSKQGQHDIGVIAQQVEEVLPELVHTNDEGYKSVSYGNLTALLIEAVKELKSIVDKK